MQIAVCTLFITWGSQMLAPTSTYILGGAHAWRLGNMRPPAMHMYQNAPLCLNVCMHQKLTVLCMHSTQLHYGHTHSKTYRWVHMYSMSVVIVASVGLPTSTTSYKRHYIAQYWYMQTSAQIQCELLGARSAQTLADMCSALDTCRQMHIHFELSIQAVKCRYKLCSYADTRSALETRKSCRWMLRHKPRNTDTH
jgi:hypothetical protein